MKCFAGVRVKTYTTYGPYDHKDIAWVKTGVHFIALTPSENERTVKVVKVRGQHVWVKEGRSTYRLNEQRSLSLMNGFYR